MAEPSRSCGSGSEMKRLFVGGLGSSVTDKDLRDRFGKFGKVEDVELKTRTDDQGCPYKTFGYINISMSDSDLKKCLSVLNKSKWKGGILQIETAKESFLQRLAQERQEAAQLRLNPPKTDQRQQVLDSLSKAGVHNFTMKSAVPGTEIPGHKDWVVGKFGRVLPVLQLKCRRGDKVRTLKYDPSKYTHNLRVLAQPPDSEATSTPVSELTWQVSGGDNEISRKRRGEFPLFTPETKTRKRTERPDGGHRSASELVGSCNGSNRPIRKPRLSIDSQSDEELPQVVSDHSSHNALGPEDDALEVVSLDFLHNRKKDEDCDSGDTDELFASRKPLKTGNVMPPNRKRKKRDRNWKQDSTDDEEEEDSGKTKQRKIRKSTSMAAVNHVETKKDKQEGKATHKSGGMEGKKGDEEMAEDMAEETNKGDVSEEESDNDYEALFSNVTRLEMSLFDLQKVAEKYAPQDWTHSPRILSDDDIGSSRIPKKGTTPEEILAAILEDDSCEENEDGLKKKAKKKKKSVGMMSLPAFKGTEVLEEEESLEGKEPEQNENESTSSSKTDEVSSAQSKSSSTEGKGLGSSKGAPEKKKESSSSEEEEEEDKVSSSETESSSNDDKETPAPVAEPIRARAEEAELQRRANERRLAAVLQRQKEEEENRRLIQGALSKLDGPAAGSRGKHIVFDSDDGDEEEVSGSEEEAAAGLRHKSTSGPALFDSDDEEEDEDEGRFEIRPQFEGSAGLKLMALQSHFGTDERFKMDARFLDNKNEEQEAGNKTVVDDEEEALEEEKKKNLLILQNILGTNQTQTATRSRTFRDVSALHYDPSNKEHTAFETKSEEKESKASRRKKREEAQKLPEVSTEIYFDISTDLKEVFGKEPGKPVNQDQTETNWDQEDEEEGHKETRDETEEQGGFKFSFFGDDSETQLEQNKYKVERISTLKLLWQEPRLNDSSSDEDVDEREEEEETAVIQTPEPTPLTSDLFFFFTNDQRLTDGPQWFCRTSLQDQRETWEETRTELRQDYRKKHKDARRKLRAALHS